MTDTITVPVELPMPPEGWGDVRCHIQKPNELIASEDELTFDAPTNSWVEPPLLTPPVTNRFIFVARPLPLKGTAWLEAQDVGTVFDYNGERWAIVVSRWTRYRYAQSLSSLGVYFCDENLPSSFTDISDATVKILLPAIGADNG